MKNYCWLVLLFCFCFSIFHPATVSAQDVEQKNIRLELKNERLPEVLKRLEKVSGYKIMFTYDDINHLKVNGTIESSDINKVMDLIIGDKELDYRIDGQYIYVTLREKKNLASTLTEKSALSVDGRVLDVDRMPLAGVNVLIVGSNQGVITDENGRFKLDVPRGTASNLQFTFVGMKPLTRKVVGNKNVSNLTIIMEEDMAVLEQVVVTGYQTISKERATGSFNKVNSDHLSQPSSNIGERLIGSAAGLAATTDADGNISFQIRGLSTLVASSKEPLLIVDGFPVEASLSTLNPNNIESVTVLKDAAAASIWGAKSANGVIVVTTKSGKEAQKKGGVQVSFNAMLKYSPKIDYDYYTANASNDEIIDWQLYQFKNANFGKIALVGDGNSTSNIRYNYNSYSNLYVMLNENRLGYVSDTDLNNYIAKLRTQSNKEQIKDYLLENPFTQQYSLNVAQSSDRMTSNYSMLYEDRQQYLKGNKDNKYTFNANMNIKVYKWLDFNVNGTFYYNVNKNNGVHFVGPEFEEFFDEEGNYTDVIRSYASSNDRFFYTPNIRRYLNWQAFPYLDWGYNPVQEMRGRDYSTKTINARIQAGLNFKIAQGINFESKFQYEILNTDVKKINDETTFTVRSTINMAASSNKTPNGPVTPNLPAGSIMDQNRTYTDAYNWRNQFNFDRTFADKHQVTFIAGMEISDRVYKTVTNPTTYGYNDETLSVGKFLGTTFKYTKNSREKGRKLGNNAIRW